MYNIFILAQSIFGNVSIFHQKKGISMSFKKIFQQSIWVVIFLLIVSVLYIGALDTTGSTDNGRADIIQIQMTGGKPQMPAVTFFHDLHTASLENQDCSTCHLKGEDKQYSFKFMRTVDFDYDVNMTVYHENCIGCHNQMKSEGKYAGPETGKCRDCHNEDANVPDLWTDLDFDRSLHYRHESAQAIKPVSEKFKNNCGSCHHEYNKEARKTVYIPGKEGACQYCHQEQDSKDVRSMQTVAHESCVNCHQKLKAKRVVKTGPTECKGCHDANLQKEIKQMESVPRIKRNQPDVVLMASAMMKAVQSQTKIKGTIPPVAFNHKKHEMASQTCQKCHHASLEKCSSCHTLSGDKKGQFIPLEKAMHETKSAKSCVGCHAEAQMKKDCAGCHYQMAAGKNTNQCNQCHHVDINDSEQLPSKDDARARMAKSAVDNRKISALMYENKLVPEKVSIDVMAKEYQAADFPHEKVVKTLLARLNKNTLGTYFHQEKYSMCQGCHHNSPQSATPPKCVSCHGKTQTMSTDGRPGLKGAYHGQCIGCHEKMGIEKPAATACNDCHKKKQ
jgi:hypothetical protein